MRATTVCVCFTIVVSSALTIVGFPENSVWDAPENPLSTLNLSPTAIGGRSPIPIYNPAIAFERDENNRAKRHLFKKKKGKKGKYQQAQNPQVIVVNQYHQAPSHKGGYDGASHIQPRQPVQNHGWGWGR